jgi:single-strand DNA-binding protein
VANYNKIILVGNLTRDPESKYLPSGTQICNFGMAINSKYGDREEVLFMTVIAFGSLAEICNKYLVKGKPVLVEGRLQCREWTTEMGETRKAYEVVANSMQMLGQATGDTAPASRPQTTSKPLPGADDDDLPF